MAPLSDDTLTLLGWMIGGSVTLTGVLLASWVGEARRERNRDLIEIYERLYPLINGAYSSAYFRLHIPQASGSWFLDGRITELLQSGRLTPKRFAALRKDMNDLSFQATFLREAEDKLTGLTKETLKAEVSSLRKEEAVAGRLNRTLFDLIENRLLYPILKEDRGELFKLTQSVRADEAIIGDKELFSENAVAVYDKVNQAVSHLREEYRRLVLQYMTQAGSIRIGLRDSISKGGRRYEHRSLGAILVPTDETDPSIVRMLSDPEVRSRILTYMYDLHLKNANVGIDMAEVSLALGISRKAVLRSVMYLSEKELVQTTWMSGKNYFRDARISSSGIDEVEKEEMKEV